MKIMSHTEYEWMGLHVAEVNLIVSMVVKKSVKKSK